MIKFYAGAAVLVIVALVAAPLVWLKVVSSDDPFASCRQTAVAGGAATIGGPFTLVSETGETVTDADVITGPTLIYFGYTFCPDVCPMDVARNATAVDILEERGRMVTSVFISIDPERDTPKAVADFTDNLHPRMLGLDRHAPSRSRRRAPPTGPISASRTGRGTIRTTWSIIRHSPTWSCPNAGSWSTSDATSRPK